MQKLPYGRNKTHASRKPPTVKRRCKGSTFHRPFNLAHMTMQPASALPLCCECPPCAAAVEEIEPPPPVGLSGFFAPFPAGRIAPPAVQRRKPTFGCAFGFGAFDFMGGGGPGETIWTPAGPSPTSMIIGPCPGPGGGGGGGGGMPAIGGPRPFLPIGGSPRIFPARPLPFDDG